MKSSLEKTSGLGRKLVVDVPADKVSAVFDRIYKNLQKEANLKGFRKGKAPLSLIKTTYGDKAQQHAVEDLVSESYSLALKEHSLSPISQPQVNIEQLRENEGFKFTAEFEVRPEVKIKKHEGLKVEREQVSIDESRLQNILDRLRESKSEMVPVFEDRPAQKGDVLDIDFFGKINGVPLEGGQANGFQLELGSNSFIPGFEDGLVGVKVGQSKTLELKFPEDYGNKEIAGKPVVFDVKINKMQVKKLAEITDEFAKSLGDYADVNALKDAIRKDIEADEAKRIKDEFRTRLLKALVEANPVEVPEKLKAQQKQALLQDVDKRLRNQGLGENEVAEYKTKWDKDFDDTASFMVQSSFLVDTLADQLDLNATQAEVKKKMEEYSRQTGLELSKLLEFYGQNSRMSQLEYQITEEKVVAKLAELADVKEVAKEKLKD